MPRGKKRDASPPVASATGATSTDHDLDAWCTAGQAANILTINSGKEIKPDYLHKLGRLEKVRTKKLSQRTTLYYKPDVDAYVVEERGVKGGQAKRAGKTGPTVRQARQAAKEVLQEACG